MSQAVLASAQKTHTVRPVPEIRPGFTVRVHQKVQEGGKERIQVFEGLVIAVHKGRLPADASFIVRRVVSGIGVEKVFPIHLPTIEKIEVIKVAMVRRSKLFFLRGRRGKAARLSERFTTAEEYAVAVAPTTDAQGLAQEDESEAGAEGGVVAEPLVEQDDQEKKE